MSIMKQASPINRIHGEALEHFVELSDAMCNSIAEALEDRPRLELYTKRDVIECWLQWNGIIGFTDQIIDLTK